MYIIWRQSYNTLLNEESYQTNKTNSKVHPPLEVDNKCNAEVVWRNGMILLPIKKFQYSDKKCKIFTLPEHKMPPHYNWDRLLELRACCQSYLRWFTPATTNYASIESQSNKNPCILVSLMPLHVSSNHASFVDLTCLQNCTWNQISYTMQGYH